MRKKITFDTQFPVSTGETYLTIVIGNANPGTSTVKLDGIVKKQGAIKNFKLGKGSVLKNSKLTILSTVQDFLINNNDTNITFVLDNGIIQKKYFLQGSVDVDKDKIDYIVDISFI